MKQKGPILKSMAVLFFDEKAKIHDGALELDHIKGEGRVGPFSDVAVLSSQWFL